jgi:hypothetical protein
MVSSRNSTQMRVMVMKKFVTCGRGWEGWRKPLKIWSGRSAPKLQDTRDVKLKVYDVEAGEYENPTSYDVVSHQLTPH